MKIRIPKIDATQIIQEAKKIEAGTGKYTFKFEDGMILRLLPYKHSHNPFIGVYLKYVGKTLIYSPQNFGMPDPFFECFSETGNKKVKPSMRFFCPCIVRGKEKSGVKFASFSQYQYLKIVSFLEEVDLFDISEGHDIIVKVTNKSGTMKEIDFIFKAKATPAYIDLNYIEELYDKQPNFLEEVVRPKLKSYEELKKILERYLNDEHLELEFDSAADNGDFDFVYERHSSNQSNKNVGYSYQEEDQEGQKHSVQSSSSFKHGFQKMNNENKNEELERLKKMLGE